MRPLVLVADSDPFALALLEEACAAEGCEVMTALDGADALAAIAREAPALVIAARELEGISGVEILRIVRRDPELRVIAVLLAGERVDARDSVQMNPDPVGQHADVARETYVTHEASGEIATGALDARDDSDPDGWLARPYRVVEVQARVRELLDTRLERRRRARESETVRRVGTRAQWKLALEHEAERAIRHRAPLGCVLVDSPAPERDARMLAELLRVVDEVFVLDERRVGVLLPETPAHALPVVEARIREALPSARLAMAALPDDASDPEGLERQATRRLIAS
ncbi:MAG: response regulator [Myxococcota bacterium]|jgi:CheY-like chemotaxis protein|nr:response regulator [Myxococcota bacterium]